MINLLDNLLEKILDTDWPPNPPGPTKPGFYFAVPDAGWATRVTGDVNTNRLNLYLYAVCENRDARRSGWDNLETPGQDTLLSRPPAYFDCHYRVTSWSPTQEADPTTSPVPDEHLILSEALRVFMRNPDVVPATLGVPGGGNVFQQAHIYLTAAPPEMQPGQSDFWTTMKLPWRPSIELIVTAPLDLGREETLGPPVLTLVQQYVCLDGTGNLEEVFLAGGWVLRNSDNTPISDAIVRRVRGNAPNYKVLEEVKTDDKGRFAFTGLRGSTHKFLAVAPGFNVSPLRTLNLLQASINDHIFKL